MRSNNGEYINIQENITFISEIEEKTGKDNEKKNRAKKKMWNTRPKNCVENGGAEKQIQHELQSK